MYVFRNVPKFNFDLTNIFRRWRAVAHAERLCISMNFLSMQVLATTAEPDSSRGLLRGPIRRCEVVFFPSWKAIRSVYLLAFYFPSFLHRIICLLFGFHHLDPLHEWRVRSSACYFLPQTPAVAMESEPLRSGQHPYCTFSRDSDEDYGNQSE